MFLRSLMVRGFKSFAEKTTLEFAPGISVIVGPNGSGKSNLVDAISWVLGEQGPRALRGGAMADVIFAAVEQDGLRLQDVLAERRRQLRPLKQQAEMAKRHEQLTGQADELAWRLAAARLRALVQDREKRQGGWEEGLARRKLARERLEDLDRDIERLIAARAEVAEGVAEAQEAHRQAEREKLDAERELREAVQLESDARARVATVEAGSARLSGLRGEMTRSEVALRETRAALADRELELEEAER